MKKIILLTLPFLLLLNEAVSQEKFKVNADKSIVNWVGNKIIGESHKGTLNFKEGMITLQNNIIVAGELVVDMPSLDNTDLTGAMKNKLVGHLKSPDFFDTDKFKTATLSIQKSTLKSNGKYEIEAILKIKGIENTVTFEAKTQKNKEKFESWSELIFDRSKYDVRYGSDSFFDNLGDKAINNDIKLNVYINANLQ